MITRLAVDESKLSPNLRIASRDPRECLRSVGSGLGIQRRKSVESIAPFSTTPTEEHLRSTMEDMLLFRGFFLEIATFVSEDERA